jgi:amino acid transporter
MYKFSLLTNTILSIVFIGLVTYGLLQKATPEAGTLFAICYIIIVYASFLWFNYICFKTKQLNESHELLPATKTGKALSVVVIVLAIVNIVFAALATLPFLAGETQADKNQLIGLFVFILLSIIAGVTAIINAKFYRKALKQNKLIVNSVINTIGESTAP